MFENINTVNEYTSFLFLIYEILKRITKLRMEMRNVSKRQNRPKSKKQPKHPMGLQHSENVPHPEACFSGPLNKMYTSLVIMNVILNSEIYK